MSRPNYGSPAPFRRALTDKLRAMSNTGTWTLTQLQRQFAYDRLLERLYLVDNDWVVKGAVALLAREIGVRASVDVDIYRNVAPGTGEAEVREAAGRDLGDWFQFSIGAPQPLGSGGVRLPVVASVGLTEWASFHVDIVGTNVRMTGQPEHVPPLARVAMPDIEQHGYRAYPLVDHIADKVCATLERHGPMEAPSTRYRDLVDLVAIVRAVSVGANDQAAALRSESERRGLSLPDRFDVPDTSLWKPGYEAEAARSVLPVARTLPEALAVVGPFLDPLLQGPLEGVWDPERQAWESPSDQPAVS